jgi:serine/threonine protein kinase
MMSQQNLELQQLAKHSWSDNDRNAAFKWATSQFTDVDHFQKISRTEENVDPEHLYSFIKLNGVVYATLSENKLDQSKNGILGKGSYGKVRIAIDKDDNQYALKVEKVTLNNRNDFTIFSNEMKITYDLWLGVTEQRFYRKHTKENNQLGKYYSLQEIKGEELYKFLKNNNNKLSDEQRLKIAINVCKAVDDLHTGRSSKTKTPYAHLDLKPENILIDQNLNVQIIDFGMATSGVDKKVGLRGSPVYIPQNYQHATCRQRDIFALQRILHVKDSYKAVKGQPLIRFNALSLLTNDQFDSLNHVLATAENKTTDKEIGDIYLALKEKETPQLGVGKQLEISALKEKGILTVQNIDRVISGELTVTDLNDDNLVTALRSTKHLDLDFNTIKSLADKKLTASQFIKVHYLIKLDIGKNVRGICDAPNKNKLLNDLEKKVYESILSEKPQDTLETKINEFIQQNSLNKNRHLFIIRHIGRILKVGLQVIGLLTFKWTSHYAKAIEFNFQNGFFATNREQTVRQAFREMKSGEDNISTALRA